MTSLRLHYDSERNRLDLAVVDGRLDASDAFDTDVFVSLFTWRRASADDLKRWGFAPEQNQGSWQEDYPRVPGYREGSLLWLLAHGKKEDATLRAAESFAIDALRWLKEDQLAKSVAARADWHPGTDILVLVIDVVKADGTRWVRAWNAINGFPHLPALPYSTVNS